MANETRTATIKGETVQFDVPKGSDDDFATNAAIQAYKLKRFNTGQKRAGGLQYTGKPGPGNPAGSVPSPIVQPVGLTGRPATPEIAKAWEQNPIARAAFAPISGKSWQGKTADILEGAGTLAGAAFAPEVATINPGRLLAMIGAGEVGGKVAGGVADLFHASPDTHRLVSDAGNIVGGAVAGSPKITAGLAGGLKRAYNNPPEYRRFGPAGLIGAMAGFARNPNYSGMLGGSLVGGGAEALAESGMEFGRGAMAAAKDKPILPFNDNFQPRTQGRPSPVVAPPKQLPPAPVSTEPKLLGPATQIQMPAGQPLPPTAAPAPVAPKFPVKAPQPAAVAPVAAPVPVQAPVAPIAPPVVAPKPPEPIVPTAPVTPPQDQSAAMKALGVKAKPTGLKHQKAEPKTSLSPPIKPTEAKPAEPKVSCSSTSCSRS